MMEITSEEQNKVERMKRTEDRLRDLWDNSIKCTNIQIIGVPEEGNGTPLQYSCLENGAWQATVHATSLSLFIFMHWRRKWQPTPVFLPVESQGQGSLVGCCLWGHTELDTTEVTQQQQQQQQKKRKRKCKKIFEEIIVENFSNMEKEIVNQVQEAQRVPYRINSRRNMPRHMLIKLTKTKHKERRLKATSNIQRKLHTLNS